MPRAIPATGRRDVTKRGVLASYPATVGTVLEKRMGQQLALSGSPGPSAHSNTGPCGEWGAALRPLPDSLSLNLLLPLPLPPPFPVLPSLFNQETFVVHPLYFREKSVFQAC